MISKVGGFLLASSLASATQISRLSARHDAPIGTSVNGTYSGRYVSAYNQDAFLGIPYAQPPLGDLRFRRPVSLNSSWDGTRDAKEFGYSCYQSGNRTDMNEECLTLNVFRPAGTNDKMSGLPVFVIIYGGGFYAGSSAEKAYDPSNIIALSEKLSKPIIAVSLNYRLDVWGFLSTPEILAEKEANAGLMDQRMALRWIKENIAGFGGNPNRVTVWGVSAGAQSIALHLHSFAGRGENLFHGAIMESGGPVGTALQALPFYTEPFENLAKANKCDNAADKLRCLRTISSKQFATNKPKQLWNPIVDGDFLSDYPSALTASHTFIKVSLITGTNTDEGTSFSANSKTTTTDTALTTWLHKWRNYNLSTPTITNLLSIYSNYTYPPYHTPPPTQFPKTAKKWRESAAIGGDIVQHSQRRKIAETYSAAGCKLWSFRFDTRMWNSREMEGVNHGAEVAFTLQNSTGTLGPMPEFAGYRNLSEAIGRAYINFVYEGDVNERSVDGEEEGKGVGRLPYWPSYDERKVNMVLNAEKTELERDDYREEGIKFINSISRELLA